MCKHNLRKNNTVYAICAGSGREDKGILTNEVSLFLDLMLIIIVALACILQYLLAGRPLHFGKSKLHPEPT